MSEHAKQDGYIAIPKDVYDNLQAENKEQAEQIAALEQDYKAAREIGEAYDPDGMAMKNRELQAELASSLADLVIEGDRAHAQAEQITELEELHVDAENRVTEQAEQITTLVKKNKLIVSNLRDRDEKLKRKNAKIRELLAERTTQ